MNDCKGEGIEQYLVLHVRHFMGEQQDPDIKHLEGCVLSLEEIVCAVCERRDATPCTPTTPTLHSNTYPSGHGGTAHGLHELGDHVCAHA